MLHELKVDGLPETPDSLAWSEAGDLCIVTGGKIPSRKANPQHASQPALKAWNVVVLEVNTFNVDEWPNFSQRSYADLSIGEEESESHVVSCSWSAPGLAQHDRCMLGILTANGLYSLWDADGDPCLTMSWKRVLVLNRIVEPFFATENIESSVVPPRRYRIRAGAWTKALEFQSSSSTKIFTIALLNDGGEIIFMNFTSVEDDHQVQPTPHTIHALNLNREISPFPDGSLDELQWLDWTIGGDMAVTTLLCSTEGHTWAIRVQIEYSQKSDLTISTAVSEPGNRVLPSWNTSKGQITMLKNQYLVHRHKNLKKTWELEKAEGYHGFTRYYGIANYKDFQAIHISFHPRNVIEYHIQAQERSYVIFSNSALEHSTVGAEKLEFDWQASGPVKTLPDSSSGPWGLILPEASELHLRESLGDDFQEIFERIVRLYLVMALFHGWQIVETSNLVSKMSSRPLNQEYLDAMDEYKEESSSREAIQQIEGVVDSFLDTLRGTEACAVCGERLKWHGERAALCDQGHQFDRCSLTLLAIQEPGVSKFCRLCNREYIDRNFLLKGDGTSDSQPRRVLSDLFKSFPRCIYCGGTLQGFT